MSAAPIAPEHRKRYLLSGRATVTVVSAKTGKRFTYRMWGRSDAPGMFIVEALRGPDNLDDYTEVGFVDLDNGAHFVGHHNARTVRDPLAASARAFAWVWKHIESTQFELWHAGHCGRCGRLLTDPESIARGLGPKCAQMGAAA